MKRLILLITTIVMMTLSCACTSAVVEEPEPIVDLTPVATATPEPTPELIPELTPEPTPEPLPKAVSLVPTSEGIYKIYDSGDVGLMGSGLSYKYEVNRIIEERMGESDIPVLVDEWKYQDYLENPDSYDYEAWNENETNLDEYNEKYKESIEDIERDAGLCYLDGIYPTAFDIWSQGASGDFAIDIKCYVYNCDEADALLIVDMFISSYKDSSEHFGAKYFSMNTLPNDKINDAVCGAYYVAALTSSGEVECIIPDDIQGNALFPAIDMAAFMDIVDIDSGFAHIVGVKMDGTVVAAGNNDYGQCDVEAWTDIAAVAAGKNFTVGLKEDGTVVAAGPEKVLEFIDAIESWENVKEILAGEYAVYGLTEKGNVLAAGGDIVSEYRLTGEPAVPVKYYWNMDCLSDVVSMSLNGNDLFVLTDTNEIHLINARNHYCYSSFFKTGVEDIASTNVGIIIKKDGQIYVPVLGNTKIEEESVKKYEQYFEQLDPYADKRKSCRITEDGQLVHTCYGKEAVIDTEGNIYDLPDPIHIIDFAYLLNDHLIVLDQSGTVMEISTYSTTGDDGKEYLPVCGMVGNAVDMEQFVKMAIIENTVVFLSVDGAVSTSTEVNIFADSSYWFPIDKTKNWRLDIESENDIEIDAPPSDGDSVSYCEWEDVVGEYPAHIPYPTEYIHFSSATKYYDAKTQIWTYVITFEGTDILDAIEAYKATLEDNSFVVEEYEMVVDEDIGFSTPDIKFSHPDTDLVIILFCSDNNGITMNFDDKSIKIPYEDGETETISEWEEAVKAYPVDIPYPTEHIHFNYALKTFDAVGLFWSYNILFEGSNMMDGIEVYKQTLKDSGFILTAENTDVVEHDYTGGKAVTHYHSLFAHPDTDELLSLWHCERDGKIIFNMSYSIKYQINT